jgi:N-acyl-D-aspartate/D-glutamate deacylase
VYDLKISGGTIVDGTGGPRFAGALGVKDGKVAAVGEAPEDAATEIDGSGMIVSPGFIDIHTHYDAQVLWDPLLTFSPSHGVTTVVQGNCGFAIAPTRRRHREYMLRTLQDVEGMSYQSTSAGLGAEWGFETFPEYLDALEARGVAVNVAQMIGHTGVRVWVMGEDAAERHPTEGELAQMHRLVEEAFEAGAVAFSSSNSPAHTGHGGKPVPSRVTSLDELCSFATLLQRIGRGSLQLTWGPEVTPDNVLRILAAAPSVPVTDPGIAARGGEEDKRIEALDEAWRRGQRWYPQVSAMPNTFEVSLARPFMFALDQPAGAMKCEPMHDLFDELVAFDSAQERLDAYRRPGFRAAFVAHAGRDDWLANYWPWLLVGSAPGHDAWRGRKVVDIAAEQGVSPGELFFDLSMETHLEVTLLALAGNRDPAGHLRLLRHPHLRIGLADSGAHNGEIADYRYPTHVLAHWVREEGAFTLEEAVKMMTADEAECYGLEDRGTLAVGQAADVVVFDPEQVGDGPVREVHDLPMGARRLCSEGIGIAYVIVNGTVLRAHDHPALADDDRLPGRVLRRFAGHR